MDDESMLTAVIWAVAEEQSHDVKKSATSLRAKCTTWQKSGGSINGIQLNDKNIATAERATEWLESLSDRQSLTPGKKSFLQIANFWKKHGIEKLLPGDVGSCRNWGYAIRDGELTPVMLDVGFSQKVADIFYEDNHMNNESKLINYWAHMLDESSNTNITDVKIVPDDDYESEVEYNSSLPSFQQKHLVKQSEIGLDLANGIYKPEQIINPELIPEAKHSMHGPAYARKTGGIDEIADMREKLANGVVEFTFWKHGEEGQGEVQRRAVGTTSEQVIPISVRRELDPNYDENVASYERRSGFIIWFWDLEKDAARCFNTNRFDEIVNYVPTTTRYNDEDSIGPIEINKFVDDFDMP